MKHYKDSNNNLFGFDEDQVVPTGLVEISLDEIEIINKAKDALNFANNAIRNGIETRSLSGVENRVIELEKLTTSFVELSDKMFDELEKTYAIDSQ